MKNCLFRTGLMLALGAGILGSWGPGRALAEEGCVTSDCHSAMGNEVWVHGPVGVGACSVCHVAIKGEDHKFNFAADKQDLCFACHEDSRDLMLEQSVHTPVAEGKCTACHDPHQSPNRFTLKGAAAELCFQCHDRTKFDDENVHAPVEGGDCNVCHDPHASGHVNQLVEAPEYLCFQCHDEKEEETAKRHPHKPVTEGCVNCHQPHATKAEHLLDSPMPGLCFTCHAELARSTTVEHQHPPVANGSCGECHQVHGSDNPRLFPMAPTQLCFSCHAEMAEYVTEQDFKHGPVKEGDCNACHDPHGSDFYRSLRKAFPEEFYIPYAEANYDLCFQCHNRQIAQDAETDKLTEFRDGKTNLHYLHVNKDQKGRSCKACHQVHASSQERHIRLTVPYLSLIHI